MSDCWWKNVTECDYCEDDNVECHVCHDGEDISCQMIYEIVWRDQHLDYDGYPCDKGEEVFKCECGKNYHRSWSIHSGGAGGDEWVDKEESK